MRVLDHIQYPHLGATLAAQRAGGDELAALVLDECTGSHPVPWWRAGGDELAALAGALAGWLAGDELAALAEALGRRGAGCGGQLRERRPGLQL